MKQVILTESQINILMESDMIIESIFNIGPIKNFKYDGVLNDYNEMFHIKRNKSII